MTSLALCIVTATPALVKQALSYAHGHATDLGVSTYVFENGCETDVSAVRVHSEKNVGVVPALHALYEAAHEDVLVFIHDDLEIYEDGWDERIRARFDVSPDCALVAFGGAETLGREDMYECGSEWEPTRGMFYSNLTRIGDRKEMTVAEDHGKRVTADRRIATFDGFGFAVRRSFLESIGGFSWWPLINHGYDAALACQVRRAGKETWLVPIAIGHPWIGATSQTKAGLETMAKAGGNYGVYVKSVQMVREMFRDVLPFAVSGAKHSTMAIGQVQPVIDNYFGAAKDVGLEQNTTATAYLDLLKSALTGDLFEDPNALPGKPSSYDPVLRAAGKDWPATAVTMVGRKRLDNFQSCIEDTIAHDVPGDVVETGVWRGGASILARGVLKAYAIGGRQVWVCDSFEGLPPPELPQDKGDLHHTNPFLAVSLEQVKANFAKFGLLDDQVTFVKGWFRDTLPTLPVGRIAVLRLDGDMYESTLQALDSLYPHLSKGGYLIVDDYHELESCRRAVTDFRAAHGLSEPIQEIDGSGVFWQKDKTWFVPPRIARKVTMVIPTLTREGSDRTNDLITAALAGTRPPDRVFVVNNGGYFPPGRFQVEVFSPGKNVGYAAAVNEAIRRFPDDYLIVANDDCEIQATTIEEFVKAADRTDRPLVTCSIGQGYPFVLHKPAATRLVGLYDERFLAYFEDTDYLHRLKLAGQVPLRIDGGVKHGEGGTSSREAGLTGLAQASAELYRQKWGGGPGHERGVGKAPVPGKKSTGPVVSMPGFTPKQNRFKR